MTDQQSYDPHAYPPMAVTVDLVLMTVAEGRLCVLLTRRGEDPFAGRRALPGGFVGPDESLEGAARRVLAGKARLGGAWLEQLYSFGAPDRDPRMRIVTVAYFALLPQGRLSAALAQAPELALAPAAPLAAGEGEALAFDHGEIVALALQRLRGKLDYAPVAFSLLPELFTLRALQDVHEAILGRPLNKPAFRRRMLDRGWLEPTGARETGAAFRPAELYTFQPPSS